MVKLGIISAYPDEDWHARRILEAAAARGSAEVLSPLDFAADVEPGRTGITADGEPHQRFDAFLTPRALGDDGDPELQVELYQALVEEGALVINAVRALTQAVDKFRTSILLCRAGIPTPRTIVVQRRGEIGAALRKLGGRAVAKPLYGSLGIGVCLVDEAAGTARAEERLHDCMGRWRALYLQAFADGGGRDLRAFVIGARVRAAISRTAPPGELCSNLHLGGRAEGVRLSRGASSLAVRAAAALGLDYAGVDLIETADGPRVIEVNGTPQFRGILEATGRDMAKAIVDHACLRVAARRRSAGQRRPKPGVAIRRRRGAATREA